MRMMIIKSMNSSCSIDKTKRGFKRKKEGLKVVVSRPIMMSLRCLRTKRI